MIIDFHVHCFPDDLAPRAVPALAQGAGIKACTDGTVEGIKQSMKKAGIDCSVVLSIATKPHQTEKVNDWSAQINQNDICAFGSIHPEYTHGYDELTRIQAMGLKGIKLHPEYQSFFVDDPAIYPLYERAFELGLIVLFHAGVDIGLKPPYHCTPDRLLKLVKAFPGGKMVAAHMGGYDYWNDVEKFLLGQELYFDTSYSLGRMSDEQAVRIIQAHGYQKILFATDSPWANQAEEIERLKRLKLSQAVEEAILGGNAKHLLNL